MTEENKNSAKNGAEKSEAVKHVSVLSQYVKDISFESPNSPGSLQSNDKQPKISVSVDVAGRKLQNDLYEVELRISATAKREEEVLFIAEVNYGGVFQMTGVPENEIQPALLVFCPSLLFPFVRRIISDLTRDGGFPALLLDPVDFGKLYIQRMQAQSQVA